MRIYCLFLFSTQLFVKEGFRLTELAAPWSIYLNTATQKTRLNKVIVGIRRKKASILPNKWITVIAQTVCPESQLRPQTASHGMPLALFVLFTFLQFYPASVESSTSEGIIILSTTKHPSPPRIIRLQSLQALLPCIQLLLINWNFGGMWHILLGCSGCSYNRIRRSSILILWVFT